MEKMVDEATTLFASVPQGAVAAIVFVGILLVLFGLIAVVKRAVRSRGNIRVEPAQRRRETAYRDAVPPPVPKFGGGFEIAETTTLNGFGQFFAAMMMLNWGVAGLMFLGANGAIQQAVAALVWIGGNTMFGIGAVINRERTYRVVS